MSKHAFVHLTESRMRFLQAELWRGLIAAIVSTIAAWRERARSRRVLAALGDHRLRDIGLSRAEARLESEKPFWRP
jgi:uncharacterized protein YjiS (DUF1127 family)